jgi:hypothetical protein
MAEKHGSEVLVRKTHEIKSKLHIQGVSLAIGPKIFLITFKVIDVI